MATNEVKIGDIFERYNRIYKLYGKLIEYEMAGLKREDPKVEMIWDLLCDERKEADRLLLSRPLTDGYYDKILKNMVYLNKIKPFDTDDYTQFKDFNKFHRLAQHLYELDLDLNESKSIDGSDSVQDAFCIDGVVYNKEDAIKLLEQTYSTEDIKEAMDEILEQDKDTKAQFQEILNNYYNNLNRLETHVYASYLQKRIDEEKNPKIKRLLIKVKYGLISTFRSLEATYIMNLDLETSIEFAYKELARVFEYIPDYYERFLYWHEENLEEQEYSILERKKEKYNNIDEKIDDILKNIYMKTHISCTTDEKLRKRLQEDIEAAAELAQTKIDKKVFVRTKQLNPKYHYSINVIVD